MRPWCRNKTKEAHQIKPFIFVLLAFKYLHVHTISSIRPPLYSFVLPPSLFPLFLCTSSRITHGKIDCNWPNSAIFTVIWQQSVLKIHQIHWHTDSRKHFVQMFFCSAWNHVSVCCYLYKTLTLVCYDPFVINLYLTFGKRTTIPSEQLVQVCNN